MESHEVFREMFRKGNPKEIADALGVSLSLVYKWGQKPGEDQSGSRNPLDRIAILLECTKDRSAIDWLCKKAGGYFIKDPEAKQQKQRLFPATNEILQEFAEMLSVIAQVTADRKITKEEARQIRAKWESLKSITEGFVHCAESGEWEELLHMVEEKLPEETRK